ncbi:MAG: hypothetical protein JXB38_17755 [Anaerolineales bacterium]|nr:hypothetical protein [Anaerolineales bacterium]
MNDHTARLLKRQLVSLDEYEQGIISIKRMLSGLNGARNAMEETLPDAYYHIYSRCEGMLDMLVYDSETRGEEFVKEHAQEYVDKLRNSIQALLAENGYAEEDIELS